MTISRLPTLQPELAVARNALDNLFERSDVKDLPLLLKENGWLWPEEDELPLPRPQLVALVSSTLGQHGVSFDIASSIRSEAIRHDLNPRLVDDWAALAAISWVVGAALRLVDDTVDWIKTRKQFGKPVGQNQAVQHRAVDMHIDAEAMHALLWATATRSEPLATEEALDTLADFCWRANRRVGQAAIQLHGAIAMTNELPVGGLVLQGEAVLANYARPATRTARARTALITFSLSSA